jgi:hypothetical protein
MPIVCAAVVGAAVRGASANRRSASLRPSRAPPVCFSNPSPSSPPFPHTQNNPVFLETYGDAATNGGGGGGDASTADDGACGVSLRYHYAVHCSLDAVEERRERGMRRERGRERGAGRA